MEKLATTIDAAVGAQKLCAQNVQVAASNTTSKEVNLKNELKKKQTKTIKKARNSHDKSVKAAAAHIELFDFNFL